MLTNQIREDVKNAALAGLWDALVEMQTGMADHRTAAEALRARLAARQLPAPEPAGLDLLAEARAAGIDSHQSAGGNCNQSGNHSKPRGRKKVD
jgi:hypothetical protein